MTALVVCRNSDVNKLGRGVGITQGDNRDIDIGSFFDSLSIGTWVGDDDQTGFLERTGDVIGEISGSEATSNCDSTSMSGEFKYSALTIGAGGDDSNIGRVVHCCNDAGCQNDLLPDDRNELKGQGLRGVIASGESHTMSCQY